jgi:hypothetical protein
MQHHPTFSHVAAAQILFSPLSLDFTPIVDWVCLIPEAAADI